MGPARLGWDEIPLAAAGDTLSVTVPGAEAFGPATAVNMGNPHAVFFVPDAEAVDLAAAGRSEEHTSELQSLMRISYAVFCLKKKKSNREHQLHNHNTISPRTQYIHP